MIFSPGLVFFMLWWSGVFAILCFAQAFVSKSPFVMVLCFVVNAACFVFWWSKKPPKTDKKALDKPT